MGYNPHTPLQSTQKQQESSNDRRLFPLKTNWISIKFVLLNRRLTFNCACYLCNDRKNRTLLSWEKNVYLDPFSARKKTTSDSITPTTSAHRQKTHIPYLLVATADFIQNVFIINYYYFPFILTYVVQSQQIQCSCYFFSFQLQPRIEMPCLALPSAVLTPRFGHTMNELSPLASVFRIHERLGQCVSSPM